MTRAPALPLENLASPGPVEERAVNPAAAEVAAHQAATTTTTTHPHLYGVDPQPDGLTMAGAVPPLPLMRTTTMTRAPPLHLANPASLAEVEESLERVAEAAAESRVRAATPAARPPTMMMITHPGTPTTKDTGSTSHRILPAAAAARLPRTAASLASPAVEAARAERADTMKAAAPARPLLLAMTTAVTPDGTADTEATADGAAALEEDTASDGVVDGAVLLRAGTVDGLRLRRTMMMMTMTPALAAIRARAASLAAAASLVSPAAAEEKVANLATPAAQAPTMTMPTMMTHPHLYGADLEGTMADGTVDGTADGTAVDITVDGAAVDITAETDGARQALPMVTTCLWEDGVVHPSMSHPHPALPAPAPAVLLPLARVERVVEARAERAAEEAHRAAAVVGDCNLGEIYHQS